MHLQLMQNYLSMLQDLWTFDMLILLHFRHQRDERKDALKCIRLEVQQVTHLLEPQKKKNLVISGQIAWLAKKDSWIVSIKV